MVIYKVYRVKFRTLRGTWREYVGHTRSLDLRQYWAEKEPPPPLRCRDLNVELNYVVLVDDIPSKEMALALEALYAARAMVAEPFTVRGGPWSKWTLSEEQWQEARAAARCRSLLALNNLGEANPKGFLHHHLRDLEFLKPSDAPANSVVTRGAVVRKKSSSGPCGSQYRKAAVKRGVLKRPSGHFTQLKRGVIYEERRAEEQKNRKKRPGGDRKRKLESARRRRSP